jgi:hypothetical protein
MPLPGPSRVSLAAMNSHAITLGAYPKCPKTPVAMLILKLLHQVRPYRPHPCPFAVDVHWNSEEQKAHLDSANSKKYFLAAVRFEPVREEKRKDEAVEYVYEEVSGLGSFYDNI